LLAALAYVVLLAIIALGVPLAINLSARVKAEVRTQAQAQADLIAATAADLLGVGQRRELTTLATTAATSLRGRILIVNATGGVLVDSAGPTQVGASYESRPEIEGALSGRQVQVQRTSRTLGQEILATAVPIIRNGRPVGAVRVTQSIAAVNSAVRRAELGLGLIGVIVLALGLLAGAIIAAQVGRPIGRLERVAQRVARGELGAQAEIEGSREQRSLAVSFNEMTERIARLLGVQREFVADASHQLRTPLTGLRLRLEEARAQGVSPAAAKELDAAVGEVDRLAHTVQELLVLSGVGERQTSGRPLDLEDVARSTLHRWQPAAASRGIELTYYRERAPATAWGAWRDVERALDCLLENAINYSPAGSGVELVTEPGRIEVRDRGPGVADDEHNAVFERFHRGRAGRSGPTGSGLGLAIARELAHAWSGEVTIQDRKGGGSVAALSLPVPAEGDDQRPSLRPLNPSPSRLSP
jgi:two-component system, OmpR family, sensor kinase